MNEMLPIPLDCLCASFRRASRALTQHYDEALRPLGLRSTQFTILQALSLTGEVLQGKLGEILALDSTTLTRTLEIMIGHGWITKRHGQDRRERYLRLSKAGRAEFKRAHPYWRRVQKQLRKQLGNTRWDHLLHLTNQVTAASATAQSAAAAE
jgi:DNA-binding MarR family transcriptional regulator